MYVLSVVVNVTRKITFNLGSPKFKCVCVCMCMHIYVHAYVCVHACICVCTRMHACVCVCLCVSIYYICTYASTCTGSNTAEITITL